MRLRRKALEVVSHALVQQFVLGEEIGEAPQFRAVGQFAPDQKMSDLDKARFLRQFLDGYAPIPQNALLPVDERDLALAGPGIAIAVIQRDIAGIVAEGGDIKCPFLFRPLDDGEFDSIPVEFQFRGSIHKRFPLNTWPEKLLQDRPGRNLKHWA